MFASTAVLLLTGALSAAPIAQAADSTETALNTQTQQMDSLASTQGGAVSGRISSDFSAFAGSTENSDALVAGLRNGSAITLTSTDSQGAATSTTFTPPTGKMGYGNVYTSLSLAKQQLAAAGITDPTPAEIEAALMGGTVTASNGQTTTLTGVLELRAQGMGWGQIAKSYGYKLGPVISGMRSSNAKVTAGTSGSSAAAKGSSGANSTAEANRSGIVTGAGTEGRGQGHAYGRGLVSGAGTTGNGGQGHGNAYGRGIVTGAGSVGGGGYAHGNAYGRGIVSGAGGMGGQAAASGGGGKALGKGH